MASNITLSASVRQNLLSLQSTAQLMSMTQNRLATGKKVNSALDNPGNFFTSQSLSNRASDLSTLLDSINQAQQTVKAADTGITSLTKLVESAKSLAKQAQQSSAPASTGALTIAGNSAIAADDAAVLTGTAAVTGASTLASLGYSDGDTIDFSDGTNSYTFTVGTAATDDVDDLIAGIGGSSLNATAAVSGGNLVMTASSGSETLSVTNGAGAFGTATTASATNATLGALTGSLTVQVGSGAAQTITFGSGAGEVNTRAGLTSALSGLTGVTASINSSDQIEIASTSTSPVTIGGSAAGTFFDAANVGANNPVLSVATANYSATRTTYEDQYNDLLKQIDTLATDATYNGINLLAGDDLKVVFNENGSSSLTIKGVKFDSASLGLDPLAAGAFQSNSSIDAVLGNIDAALGTLRTQAAKFGSNLSTVQTRQDFTKSMVNNLQVGADALVLADTNEEGANLLALQTRQQLSTTALSLSAQADQAVLRLF